MERIEKLVIVGVGLIGGSFALALKEAGAVGRVVGVGRGASNIRSALELGIIDAAGALDAEDRGVAQAPQARCVAVGGRLRRSPC